jgi:hypothetical protein
MKLNNIELLSFLVLPSYSFVTVVVRFFYPWLECNIVEVIAVFRPFSPSVPLEPLIFPAIISLFVHPFLAQDRSFYGRNY